MRFCLLLRLTTPKLRYKYFNLTKLKMNKRCESDWQLKKEKLTERGKYLLESGLWSDCKFLVGEIPNQQELAAHKIFLTMASPVFEVMFHGEMAERNIITVNDIQPDAFKAMLLYVYSDIVDLQSFDQACELCYVAKKYMMPHLVKICTDYIWKDLNEENACRAFEFGRLFEESILMDKSMVIICAETKHILEDPKFTEVELTTLLAILDQDKLNIDSEMQLFNAVHKWAVAECKRKEMPADNSDSLRSIALPAVQKLRFLTMKPSEFSTIPAKSQLLQQSEAFAILMNLCSDKENFPMPVSFSTSITPRYKVMNEIVNFQPNYCERTILQQTAIHNFGNSESSLSFKVNRDVLILGIQVHSQVLAQSHSQNMFTSYKDLALNHPNGLLNCTFQGHGEENNTGNHKDPSQNTTYRESLYAQLLGDDNSCITFCHFQKSVHWNKILDVHFNVPYKVINNKTYKVNVILRKSGWYPMGKYIHSTNTCGPVTFTFSNEENQQSQLPQLSQLDQQFCFVHSIIFYV
ncbi:BTB/POZ domain-containing protein 6-B-like [Lycorma delicatula]|uniref:BTB/POZ domain-containing protein 6-B-like n=1 Tax=Lycorma delicatula TaxID=130591 RepID=UPI003F50ED48